MLRFRLAALNAAEATSDTLAAWEIAALFLGEATPGDLPVDEDEARNWYINNHVAEDSQSDYRAEPQIADAEMMESFSNGLRELAESRSSALGDSYPFILKPNFVLERKGAAALGPVWASYLALQFFRALTSGLIEIEGANDAAVRASRDAFEREFRKLFEYIAGYAVSGKHNGAAYMTSHCRSSQRLAGLLAGVCRKLGSGEVIPFAFWNLAQRAANDGGVDCLVHIGGPGVPGDAEIALVGASVQKSDIASKIMGPEKIDFFRRFFATQPTAFRGILVRPQDEDALTREKCVQKDCLLYSYEQVWNGMGRRNGGDYQTRILSRLDAKARVPLKRFQAAIFIYDYEDFQL